MTKIQQKPACSNKSQYVRYEDLPLSCPTDEMALWNAHPKVYLPMGDDGKATCPYCGTLFVLQSD